MNADQIISERYARSEILLIGGSAGSFKPIFQIAKILPVNINKAVVIIMHRKRNFVSEIDKLFAQSSHLTIVEINDKDEVANNTIFLAPANYHTLIEKDKSFALDVSDAVWYSKPSIDITFESAAETYQDRCTAILMSGANEDGANGLLKLKQAGSLTIAQHPDEADMREMPEAAITIGAADYVLRTGEIYKLLAGQV